jgi:BirA family biotin operon repressor/biotin-[acetyl-CoA-carboxylase] ligase
LALAGEPEGAAVVAEAQRAGRGRRGRSWFSPAGAGLYVSFLVRPGAEAWSLLTLSAGVAAARAIRGATGLPVELKWPNDLMAGRPWRKLGGVLSETAGAGAAVEAVVVGVGLNLRPAAYPPDVASRATAIEIELGRPVDRAAIVAALVDEFAAAVGRLRRDGPAAVCDDWRALAAAGLYGAAVRWQDQGGDRVGQARDIDDDGALVVESNDGLVRIVSGEVVWERLARG